MLDLRHLRHQVGGSDQPGVRLPAGDHHVLPTGPRGQHADHLVDVHPAPLHRVGELVEHVQAVGLGSQVPGYLRPALDGLLGLAAGVPLDPGPALAHLVPADRAALAGLAEQPERPLLADPPLRRLDELEDPDRPALVPGPQGQAERGGRLPLARAGVHDDQRAVPPLPGGQAVVRDVLGRSLRHQATLPRASWRAMPASSSSSPSRVAPSWTASRSARPSRRTEASQSTTTLAVPASPGPLSRATARTRSASLPLVARPSVTTTSRARRRGSRRRSAASTRAALASPAASGVRPPVAMLVRRRAAASTEDVGGSASSAPAPRNVTSPTLSRRW